MKIYFIRHGEKENEHDEKTYLTEKGKEQSRKLGEFIKEHKINEFYCSDLNRAKQTAEIVSKIIKIDPKVDSALNEFELDMIKKNKSSWTKKQKESHSKLVRLLDKITRNKKEETMILIIAHGFTNRFILSHLLKINHKHLIKFMQLETGVNVVSWNEKHKNWRLIHWNRDSHLI